MPSKRDAKAEDLLKDLLIVTLALSGVKNAEIRNIVGGDMNRITGITKHLNKAKGKGK